MNRKLMCFFAIFLFQCGQKDEKCPRYNFYNQFSYKVRPTAKTAQGMAVDLTGQDVSLNQIDNLTNEVEKCLEDTFGNPPRLPDDVRQKADCLVETFALPIKRECFVVKIPDDWAFSCDGTQQVLTQSAPAERCYEKGLTPTQTCPCRWRAGIQDDSIIVVTPNLFLYKDPLVCQKIRIGRILSIVSPVLYNLM